MTAEAKAEARKRAISARKLAHAAGLGERMTAALLEEIGPGEGRVIAGYMPIRTEADPRPAMAELCRMNRLCVPVIEGAGLPLKFREWTPGAPMVEGAFGAAIPAEGDWLTPEIVIVPLVAFDARLNRLGYGGGFYDRTLEGLRAQATMRAIGLAYGAQELPELPLEPTDQPLDAIVTEAGRLAVEA